MNEIYPIWWNQKVTVFNKYTDPHTKIIRWYKSVIDGVFWKYTGDKVNIGNTTLETNNIICRIREDDKFKERYQWVQLPNDEMEEYYTLGKGDIIIKGEVTEDIDEYQQGSRSNDIIGKYKELQGCMTIEEISLNTGAGRCQPHYYVKGI